MRPPPGRSHPHSSQIRVVKSILRPPRLGPRARRDMRVEVFAAQFAPVLLTGVYKAGLESKLSCGTYPCGQLRAPALAQVPMPVVTLGIDGNRFVVVERVQDFALGSRGGPLLLAYRAAHGESDEHFSHSNLQNCRRQHCL